jgi:hypothetical protein
MTEAAYMTVVSGLPRSGTSMMMQMLAAGGIPILTDGIRAADPGNPRGYLEYEPVKRTKQDPSWIELAAGKAVKVVYVHLRDLPPAHDYRVIFMRRPTGEVVASQRALLDRLGREGARIPDRALMEQFENQLARTEEWLFRQPNFRVLNINYRDCLCQAAAAAASTACPIRKR